MGGVGKQISIRASRAIREVAAGLLRFPRHGSACCAVLLRTLLEDVSNPTTVVGTGTPDSCTSDAFVDAVAKGGVITFNCGAQPHTIMLDRTAQ